MSAADRRWVGSMPDAYERFLVPTVFQPFAVDLARRVAGSGPQRVLELAAGSGALTRELASALTGAQITATDLNDAMVALGRTVEPRADWRTVDATSLRFDDASFDAIACQFGVMFFPDRIQAFAEARRVLTADGRLVFNTWGRLQDHEFQAALVEAVTRVLGAPPSFMASVVHGCDDSAALVAELAAADIDNVRVEPVTLEGRAASVAQLTAGYCLGTPLRAGIEAHGDLDAVTAAVAEEMEAQLGTGPMTGRMTALVIEAMMSPVH